MARPTKCRRICSKPAYNSFAAQGVSAENKVILTVDEYETIRLVDLEKHTHEQCAKQMDISRTTVTELYENARYKIADSIVNGKTLIISGGHYRICDGISPDCCHKACGKMGSIAPKIPMQTKGENIMRIAVTYENGDVFQHFGHTEQFKLYDIENKTITNTQIVDTNGQGHGALADFLVGAQVDVLICGGIGGGAQNALANAKILLLGGISGSADEAVEAYINGSLRFNPNITCSHHEHEHSCGEHHCGEDKRGCTGNGGECK